MLTLQLLFPLALLTCYWLAGHMERLTSGAGGDGLPPLPVFGIRRIRPRCGARLKWWEA